MLASRSGSTAAVGASSRQRSVRSRPSADASPFTYASSQAVVYQVVRSAPRSAAPNAAFGIQENS